MAHPAHEGATGERAVTFYFDRADPAHQAGYRAFTAAAGALQIGYEETVHGISPAGIPFDGRRALNPSYLEDTSLGLYDDPIYGQNAAVALEYLLETKGLTRPGTAGALSTLLMGTELRRHRLHGNLGRTINVLLAGAGIGHRTAAEHQDAPPIYLPASTVEEAIRNALSTTALTTFREKVSQLLGYQIQTGSPTEQGELLTRGSLTRGSRQKTKTFLHVDELAQSSLLVIADSYSVQRGSRVVGLLRELAAPVAPAQEP